MNWIKKPGNRLKIAWILFLGSIVAWPITALTIAKDEPVFVLSLSWLAIILTAADILSTEDIKKDK